MASIILRTAQGSFDLANEIVEDETLLQFLRRIHIPVHAVATYVRMAGVLKPRAILLSKFSEIFDSCTEVQLHVDRNIDYFSLSRPDFVRHEMQGSHVEYLLRSESVGEVNSVQLSDEDCLIWVADEVSSMLSKIEIDDLVFVIGVSGGGDSNALLTAMLRAGVPKERIHPVIVLGVPDWDSGLHNALALCKKHDLPLEVVEAEEAGEILGRRARKGNWATDFKTFFPDADLEVIGTFAVRRVLIERARRFEQAVAVLGLNLEDLLAESFLALNQGKNPLPFPVRSIDEVDFLYPLYRCPKRVIDGCYPRFARENYEARDSCTMLNRSKSYFFSQQASTILPGYEYSLLDGFQQLSELGKARITLDLELGFSTLDSPNDRSREIFEGYLQGG